MTQRCFVLLLALPLIGAAVPPLTLPDALQRATQLSTTQAAAAVRDAIDASTRARSQPRSSITTSLVSQPQSGTSPQYQSSVQYTLDFGSAVRRLGALQTAQAQLVQYSAGLNQTRRATSQAVISAFFSVAAAQSELNVQTQNASLARRTRDVANARHAGGVAPGLDVERANAADAVAQANLAAARAQADGAREILLEFVGAANPFDVVAISDDSVTLPDVGTVIDEAAKANPAINNALGAYRAAEATASIARAELSPGLTVSAGPGISRTGPAQSVGPAAMVALNVPLPNSFLRSNVVAADAAVLVAKAALEQSRKEAVRAALRARTDATSEIVRLPTLRLAMLATKHVADADLAGYRLGAVTIAELVAAQMQAAVARAALNTAALRAAEARASLQLEMGKSLR